VAASRGGLAQYFPWQFRRADGGTLATFVHLQKDGEALVAIVHDLAGLLGAAKSLRRSQLREQQMLDNSTNIISFAKDLDGRYIFANRGFELLVNRPASQIVGLTPEDLFPAEVAERLRAHDREVIEIRGPREFEETVLSGGRRRTLLASKFPLLEASGEPYAVCGMSVDITARKTSEVALQEAALAVSSAAGEHIFEDLMRSLCRVLEVDGAMVAVYCDGNPAQMRTLALCFGDRTLPEYVYELAGTPCETVVGREFRLYSERLAESFPLDADFARMGLQAYAGYPLHDSGGHPMGVLSALARHPLHDGELIEPILKIYAARASAEVERRLAERAIRQSEASYRAIFDASIDAIYVSDWDTGAIVDANPRATEHVGYSLDELKTMHPGDLGVSGSAVGFENSMRMIEEAKRTGQASAEWMGRSKDGSTHWADVQLRAAEIAGRRRILAFTRNITARKLAEQRLRESEEQYHAVFEAAIDALLVLDDRHRIVDANSQFLRMFGYQRDDIVGRDYTELLPQSLADRCATIFGEVLRGAPCNLEATVSRSDGSNFEAEIRCTRMLYREAPHVLLVLRDLSEWRRIEADRRRLEARLRQAERMEALGHLTGGVAHDFNNLLTSIMGYVDLAAERSADGHDPTTARYLENARLSCDRARALVQQMLTFSRGQRGVKRPLAVAPLVDDSMRLLRSSLPSTIALESSLDDATVTALVDPVQLDQVLLNLCINARDAMGESGRLCLGVGRVAISDATCASCHQHLGGEFAELFVADNGPGIAAELLERIFDPFFTTKAVGKGSGMGLATVHGVVHEHGGHVLVDSAPGRGARFRVLLPALDASEATQQPEADATLVTRPMPPELCGRVLLVDDERSVAEFMRDLLQRWGLAVEVAFDGAAGLEMLRGGAQFDLVISDQTMPRLTGLELARNLQDLPARPPLILYTGYRDQISAEQLRRAGVAALMNKPIEPNALLELLRRYLPAQEASELRSGKQRVNSTNRAARA
jgi:PAS domain S-box-containing protein